VLALLSLAEIRLVHLIHAHSFNYLARVAYNVASCSFIDKVNLNRLLGPFIVKGLSMLTRGDYRNALFLFNAIFITALNFTTYYFFGKLTGNLRKALLYAIFAAAGFAALQDYNVLFTWDIISVLVFTILGYLIFKKSKNYCFILLFITAIFNREDALFISLWLMIDSVGRNDGIGKLYLSDPKKLVAGLASLIYGVAYVKYIRNALWNATCGSAQSPIDNHLTVVENLKTLFISNLQNMNIIVTLFLLAAAAFFVFKPVETGFLQT